MEANSYKKVLILKIIKLMDYVNFSFSNIHLMQMHFNLVIIYDSPEICAKPLLLTMRIYVSSTNLYVLL